uniref:Major facilitator superfamily (MFS) profile domain-containing protein n=1 Tax=Pelagomonas calceolata TaxID=35677 RepID=A0A7S3ZT74_9STRA|mmetsp:Transcript_2477/g.7075  ORF Transcript_2477/g.7075 Transcript_2477/m.7075 type:complete len:438 (-) Transcript_2477:30-1343(-)
MITADYGSTDLKDLEAIKPNKKEKRPPTSSLLVVLLQGVMQVGGFTAIIPTATMYVKAVGGSASTAGWLVGITALGTGLMQPFLGYPLKHYRLKTLMLALCGFNFVGWILYALGDLSGSLATIMVARVITGLAGGPTWLSTYVARSTSTELRSHYMQYVSLSVGLGYGIGPFIGGALYAICSSLDCDGKVFNKYTSPGWLWAVFAVVVAVLLQTFMVEPPVAKKPNALGGAPSPAQTGIPWDRILPILPIVFAVPLNVGSWEVHTAMLAETRFGWSVVATALYLGGLNVVAAPTGLLPVSNYVEDRRGCLLFFGAMIAGTVFFWSYKLNIASRAVVYGVGAVVFLIGAQFAKGFGWALVSKQPPPIHRSYVMACNAGAYMLGRGTGATVAGYLPPGDAFAIWLVAIDAAAILYILLLWNRLTVPKENNSSESTHVPA